MSNFVEFFTKISSDNTMMQDLMDRVSISSTENAHATVVAFAAEQGFAFTEDEVRTNHAAILEALDADRPLSDEDMESVAGGLSKAGVRGLNSSINAFESFLEKDLPVLVDFFKKW